MTNTGIAQGANKGHIVTKRDDKIKDSKKKAAGKRTMMARSIAREVAGLAPYERRILDMIKTGGSSADKRIYKFAKKRLGTHKRALAKREDIKAINAAQRARQNA
mmetsp:Transcript_15671/g.24385  ORF Transcript_15671/g.24385 Transcript_15671/m.24385 type:complete len:105 (+) Transcript_15671:35-349(+)|eukprot:CAMPEP_0196810130 /NCGR_PEP_ID=MMETSP1362-20130617/9976_1 /TAXON_ID=163516 /ORGANISM="Leptocylindrus danicus, Strain CCMP1856" /LENGTH=104 /DNA_ID=CAMNT_0042185015 /DNA_START=53 /DNA_END=367 /DNA_ORIENTATION=+